MKLFSFWKRSEQSPVEIPEIRDPDKMDEEDRQSLREAAELEMQFCLGMRDTVTREVITSARWIQTSLLVVNGGAAVALLQSNHIRQGHEIAACALFVLGMLLALFQALVGMRLAREAPARFSRAAGYWLGVKLSLYRFEQMEREFHDYAAELTKRGRWTYIIGFASLFSFIAGCAVAAVGIARGPLSGAEGLGVTYALPYAD
jgi:hypothetical protein